MRKGISSGNSLGKRIVLPAPEKKKLPSPSLLNSEGAIQRDRREHSPTKPNQRKVPSLQRKTSSTGRTINVEKEGEGDRFIVRAGESKKMALYLEGRENPKKKIEKDSRGGVRRRKVYSEFSAA